MKHIKKLFLLLILLLLPALTLSAQTAAELDMLLNTQELTVAASARFVLGAAQLLPGNLSGAAAQAAAYELAQSKGWVKAGAGDIIKLKDAAFLIMNAFELKGGLMYSLFKSPRYAYREMVYKKLIQGRADPAMTVSGQRLLHIIGRTLVFLGENEQLDSDGGSR